MLKAILELISNKWVGGMLATAVVVGVFAIGSKNAGVLGAADGKLLYNVERDNGPTLNYDSVDFGAVVNKMDLNVSVSDRFNLDKEEVEQLAKVISAKTCQESRKNLEFGSAVLGLQVLGLIDSIAAGTGSAPYYCLIRIRPFGCDKSELFAVIYGSQDNFTITYDKSRHACEAMRDALYKRTPVELYGTISQSGSSEFQILNDFELFPSQ